MSIQEEREMRVRQIYVYQQKLKKFYKEFIWDKY